MMKRLLLFTTFVSLCEGTYAQPKSPSPSGTALPAKLLGKWQSLPGAWLLNGTKAGDSNQWLRLEFRPDGTKLDALGTWDQTTPTVVTGGGFTCSVSGNTIICGSDTYKKFRFEGETLILSDDTFYQKYTRYAGEMSAPSTGLSSSTVPMTPERRALEQCAREKGTQIQVITFGPIIPRGGSKIAKMTLNVTTRDLGRTRDDGEAVYEKAEDGKWYLTSAHAGFSFAISCATEVK